MLGPGHAETPTKSLPVIGPRLAHSLRCLQLHAPIVLSMLLNSPAAKDFSCPHTVELMTAGAPPPASVLQGIEKLGFNVTQVYGLTETYGHTVMSYLEFRLGSPRMRKQSSCTKSSARRRDGSDCWHAYCGYGISSRMFPPTGKSIGEILIRGNTVMKGYLKDADNTAASLKEWLVPYRRSSGDACSGLCRNQRPL